MKKYLFCFYALIVTCCFSCKQTKVIFNNNNDLSRYYRVKKIKFDESLYIIYAERNDSIFKIISARDSSVQVDCEKVKVKNIYDFDLKSTFPPDTLLGRKVMPNHGLKSLVYKESVIRIEAKSHNTLYIAKNLNGLCIK